MPFQGGIEVRAFVPGALPQAMLFQSCGLKIRSRVARWFPLFVSGVAPGCVVSVLRTENAVTSGEVVSIVRVGRCPRLCCFSPADWKVRSRVARWFPSRAKQKHHIALQVYSGVSMP